MYIHTIVDIIRFFEHFFLSEEFKIDGLRESKMEIPGNNRSKQEIYINTQGKQLVTTKTEQSR